MGLEICPECSKALIKEVEKCPRCGHPIEYPPWTKTKMKPQVRNWALVMAPGIIVYGLLNLRDPSPTGVVTSVVLLAGLAGFYIWGNHKI